MQMLYGKRSSLVTDMVTNEVPGFGYTIHLLEWSSFVTLFGVAIVACSLINCSLVYCCNVPSKFRITYFIGCQYSYVPSSLAVKRISTSLSFGLCTTLTNLNPVK